VIDPFLTGNPAAVIGLAPGESYTLN